jgi:hypothetical protein
MINRGGMSRSVTPNVRITACDPGAEAWPSPGSSVTQTPPTDAEIEEPGRRLWEQRHHAPDIHEVSPAQRIRKWLVERMFATFRTKLLQVRQFVGLRHGP